MILTVEIPVGVTIIEAIRQARDLSGRLSFGDEVVMVKFEFNERIMLVGPMTDTVKASDWFKEHKRGNFYG